MDEIQLKNVRTRFAPSPTGYMHVGNLRTALYTYLIARHYGGSFILRIEDTDQERLVVGADEVIYRALDTAHMTIDEGPRQGGDYGPYIQSERKGMYKKYAFELVEKGGAYVCFCTKEELDAKRAACEARGETYRYDGTCKKLSKEEVEARIAAGEPYVIRQNIPTEGSTTFHDLLYGDITVENSELEEGVLLKADGLPTYNFANVIDDHLMKINPVVRGVEYLSSAPKYNLLYEAFGWEIPAYIHLQPVLKEAGIKLSKRNGDASFEDLLKKGYLPEAVINYLALLGWSPGGEREIYSLEELAEVFDIRGLSQSPAIFDTEKLRWMNAEYIRRMSLKDFDRVAQPYYKQAFKREVDTMLLSAQLHQRTELLTEIIEKTDFIDEMPEYDPEMYRHKKMKTTPASSLEVLKVLRERLSALTEWSPEAVNGAATAYAEELGVKSGKTLYPLRLAVSGKAVTPGGGGEIAVLLGREETFARIDRSIALLEGYVAAHPEE